MTSMSFMPQLRDFLAEKGMIYTVRKFNMVEKIVHIEGVGDCKRTPLGLITKEDLIPFVPESGFETLEEWWSKIRYFIPPGQPMYLYKVVVLPLGK